MVARKDNGLGGCAARVSTRPVCTKVVFKKYPSSLHQSHFITEIGLRHFICPYLLNISPIYPSGTLSSNLQPSTVFTFPLAKVPPGPHSSYTKIYEFLP